jgi:cell division protein FtsB
MPNGSRYGLLAALLLGVVGAPAAAQTTLSLEETKQCLLDERDLQSRRSGLDERLPSLTRQADELERLRREVELLQTQVFTGPAPTPAARAEYEAARDRQYREYDAYLARMKDHNAEVARYNEDLAAFNGRCGGHRYSEYNLRLAREQLGLR